MTRQRSTAADYELDGTFMRKAGQLLRHALRTEPLRFGLAITFSAIFSIMTVIFGSLLGKITDQVVIPGVAGDPIQGIWGEWTQDAQTAIWLAGGAFLLIGIANAILVYLRRAFQGNAVAGVGARHRRAARLAPREPAGPHAVGNVLGLRDGHEHAAPVRVCRGLRRHDVRRWLGHVPHGPVACHHRHRGDPDHPRH
jgi:hypothetical protein